MSVPSTWSGIPVHALMDYKIHDKNLNMNITMKVYKVHYVVIS